MRKVDLTGQKYGRLTVLSMVRTPGKDVRVNCRCDCGGEITALAYNIRNGNTSSCGCLSREVRVARGLLLAPLMGAANRRHGRSATPTYTRWSDAKKRCHSPQNKRFMYYGARGIQMCAKWRYSFAAFFADMGECPPGLTLERLDNDKGYEPGNCIWADRERQAQNRKWNKTDAEGVREIRARAAAGEPRQHLAEAFGMTISNVEKIIARQTWKNVA